MIKRIVKLTFRPDKIEEFQRIFEASKDQIRAFKGCSHLELWQCRNPNTVFFTYSWWESPEDLEAYRQSELFRNTWSRTKVLFAGKPEAWSVDGKAEL